MKKRFKKSEKWTVGLSGPGKIQKDIHEQIEETLAERKRILPEWERLFLAEDLNIEKDIHMQLKETISAFKRSMKQHESFFISDQNNKAA
jgi:hypothetical protein